MSWGSFYFSVEASSHTIGFGWSESSNPIGISARVGHKLRILVFGNENDGPTKIKLMRISSWIRDVCVPSCHLQLDIVYDVSCGLDDVSIEIENVTGAGGKRKRCCRHLIFKNVANVPLNKTNIHPLALSRRIVGA